jgi:hypothetical protein
MDSDREYLVLTNGTRLDVMNQHSMTDLLSRNPDSYLQIMKIDQEGRIYADRDLKREDIY